MIDEPVDVGGQLHVAVDANAGLVAAQRALGQRQRGGLGHLHAQVGRCALRRKVEQPRGRDLQRHVENAPLHQRHAAALARQALHGLSLLHQHMVQKQHQAVLQFMHQPGGRLRAGQDALE